MKLNKEDLSFLQELQNELNTQPNDGNADPVFWVIAEYVWQPCWEENAEDTFIYCFELREGDYFETFKEFKEAYEERYDTEVDWDDISDIPYDCNAYEVPVERNHVIRKDTLFLTKQDALDHIKMNYYHYNDTVHTYAMTAWRSPIVEKLLKIIKEVDFNEQ